MADGGFIPSETDRDLLVKLKRQKFDKTKQALDYLRRTRASRGGTGAPLEVPANLKDAAEGKPIVITDADLDPPPDKVPFGGGPRRR